MIGNNLVRFAGSKRNLLAALASSAVFMAGCSNMTTTAPSLSPNTAAATIGGRVHGGNQPVGGATVTLYYAGQSGYGSGDPAGGAGLGNAIVAATTTSANDGTGSFGFQKSATNGQTTTGNTFSCPSSGDPLVYVVARGGNTLNDGSNSNNTAAAFIGIYGQCSAIGASSFVNLTEVTTVATMATIQQYFNPVTESIGADGIGLAKAALLNTPATIAKLADTNTGTAVSSLQLTGVVSSVNVTATPQTAKLNTIANIISACVNNASASAPACTTLFANATPPNTAVTSRPYHSPAFTQATDVLQALYYIFTNPTNGSATNLQNIFNLAPAVGAPYQPTLSSAPTDWNLAVNFSSTGTCNSGNFIGSPSEINVDGLGNLWIANGQAGGNLSEISSGGNPVSCVQSGGSNGGAVIDTSGNIWYTSASSNNIYRYKPSDQSILTYTTAAQPLAIFADGGNGGFTDPSNIYFTAGTSLYEIPNAATATSAVTPIQISSVVGASPAQIMADTDHSIWVATGGNAIAKVVPLASDPGDSLGYLNKFATYQFAAPSNVFGIAVSPNPPNVFISSNGSNNSLSYFNGSGTNYSLSWTTTAGQAGVNNPAQVVIDGRANVWETNTTANSGTGLYSLSEVTSGGISLSPDGTTSGGFQLPNNYLTGGNALAIDMSGNVWVVGSANSVTEIVGAAVPVYKPFSVGLQNGRFQTLP